MNKILVDFRIFTLVAIACFSITKIAAQKKPNIVVIMSDDIGVGDIGYYHKQLTGKEPIVPTPNIDKLVDLGMQFSDAHSPASLCAPTRFSMMTGNLPYRNTNSPWGVWGPDRDAGIEPHFTTVARIAKKGGYSTAFFGKWGLGGDWDSRPAAISGYQKNDKGAPYYGFEYSVALPEGIQNVPYAYYENGNFMKIKENSTLTKIAFSQTMLTKEVKKEKGGSPGDSNWDPSLAGSILTSKAVNYINQQARTKKPFYLYYCSQAVHSPHVPPVELNGKKIAGATLGTHGDMIVELDVQVGMLLAALKENGLYENTLFVFTSDNGGLNDDKALVKAGHNSSNQYRGKKASIYEGGHRVPFIAVWPGKIKPKTQSDVPIYGLDMVATIATIIGVPLDKTKVLDSANLLPILTKGDKKPLHKYLIHGSQALDGPFYALREGDWKLIMKGESMKVLGELTPIELYNLKDNVTEDGAKNLINNPEQANRIKSMKATYLEVRKNGASTLY
ncbi:hypothetical protein FFWV33_15085 [Flavobacterium faecale]|uniref:Sulfatase N-terminal domain-containing protein n=1 Tax=Flavobacterium faecale TaxID=1355330 RepID=A0A2S1LG94_9FLAO|nr:arylsulfatase [Flavobacterium faecale]AWG22757.1 hypothetical protein FFWV33_15085 [Flavobacterium faecale]